jgi:serine protease Do
MNKKIFTVLTILALSGCSSLDSISKQTQTHNNGLYSDIIPGVYQIMVEKGTGTGWSYRDEYIVTNRHVVGKGPLTAMVRDSYGVVMIAEVVGSSDIYDISVVKLPVKQPIEIPLSDEVAIPGDLVYAFGNPSGLEKTMTLGIVSGPARGEFIPHSAGLGPGSSGGPLVSYDGDVVGMNTMILNSDLGINMGFAINSEIIRVEVEKIIEGNIE